MANLIQTLLAQHRALEGKIQIVQQLVDAGNARGAEDAVADFKSALFAHLQLEDEELYPGLVRLGKQLDDARLATVGASFSSSMKGISQGIGTFLARYERRFDLAAFTRDFVTIRSLLGSRIQSEESALYRLYEDAEARMGRKTG